MCPLRALRWGTLVALSAAVALAAETAPPLPAPIQEVLDRVAEARQKVERLAADVTQLRVVEALDIKEELRGTMKFQMPRLLRLELKSEEKEQERVYIIGRRYAWIYRPRQKQAERFTLADVRAKAEEPENPFEYGLAVDLGLLRQRYEFRAKPDGRIGERTCAVLELVPREAEQKAAPYAKLEFWIDRELWLPIRVVQHKSDGEIVETFTLSNIVLNPKWSGDLFEFSPPRDVDVIEHEAPRRAG